MYTLRNTMKQKQTISHNTPNTGTHDIIAKISWNELHKYLYIHGIILIQYFGLFNIPYRQSQNYLLVKWINNKKYFFVYMLCHLNKLNSNLWMLLFMCSERILMNYFLWITFFWYLFGQLLGKKEGNDAVWILRS